MNAQKRIVGLTAALALTLPLTAALTVRVIQTNSAGDNVHVIDPATNKVVGTIEGIGPKIVEKISLAVNDYFASLESGEVAGEAVATEGEVAAEGANAEAEAAPEAAGETAAEVEREAVAAEETAESAAAEATKEQGPENGSAPETTE